MKTVTTLLILAAVVLHVEARAQDFANPVRINMDAGKTGQYSPSIQVDRFGRIYIVWSDFRNNSSGDLYLRSSSDGGKTFGPERAIATGRSAQAGGRRNAQFVIAPDGTLHLVWLVNTGSQSTDVMYIRSTDGGETFSEPVALTVGDEGAPQDYPCIAIDSSGSLYVAFIDAREGQTQIYFTKSTDKGSGWSKPRRISLLPGGRGGSCECCNTGIAASAEGDVYVAFRSDVDNYRDIYIARSRNYGATFDTAIRASGEQWRIGACPMAGPDITLDREGTLHIAWKDNRPSSKTNQFTYYTTLRREADAPAPDFPISRTATRTNYPSLGITPEGAILCAFESFNDGNFHADYLYSLDGGNSFGPAESLGDAGSGTLQYTPLTAIGPDGTRYAAWQDNRLGDQDIWFARGESPLELVPPGTPPLSMPADGAQLGTFYAFVWNAPTTPERSNNVVYDLWYQRDGGQPVTVNGVVGTTYRTDLDPGTYRWNVRAHTLAGTSAASETWSFSFAQSAVDEEPKGNSGWDLTVSPNSISGSEQADITVAVPTGEEARARISLIDMEGREVQLVHDGVFPATGSSFPLRGEEIPSGTYFVLLRGETRNGGTTISRRVVIRF